MKFFIALLAFVAVVGAFSDVEYQDAFRNWMHEQGKTYVANEFQQRFTIFKSNMDYVSEWNSYNSETVLGLTVMADLTNEEYQRIYLGTPFDGTERLANAPVFQLEEPLADIVDWRTKGVVTPIKNQGQCGSCWSFSTTGSTEGAHAKATGSLVSLSEQNLMDCSTAYGNQGCNGGLMDSAFRYIVANHGIDTEASYPYTARQGTCRYTTANIGATISSYKDVSAGSETALASASMSIGPISVAIDASHNSFQLYKSGVYYEPACSASKLDHGVLLVGYGSSTADYWIVKNSWGTSWGTAGYIDMSRNRSNNCGIATMASYPTV